MNYLDKLELSFWNELEKDITCEEEAQYFEQAIRILELDPLEASKELESDNELRKTLRLDVLEGSSEDPAEDSDESENDFPLGNLKMDRYPDPTSPNLFPKKEQAESSQQGFERNKKRKVHYVHKIILIR